MTLTQYEKLKQRLEISVGKSERHGYLLDKLKDIFRNKINSPRRLEQINTISELMRVLEIRDALSDNNVTALKDIARLLPNKTELFHQIHEFEELHNDTREVFQSCNVSKEHNTTQTSMEMGASNLNGTENQSSRNLKRINDTIKTEIGSFWRDLARNLGIRECDLDDIDMNNQSVESKAQLVLDKYNDQYSNPQTWFFDLCEALENARRKDLSKKIQKIMA